MKKVIWLVILSLVLTTAVVYAAPAWGEYQGNPIVRLVVDGKALDSDVPAMAINGRTMVPLRVITETLGGTVTWDQDNFSVAIDRPAPPPVSPKGWPDVFGPTVFRDKMLLTHAVLSGKAPDLEKLVRDNVEEIWLGIATQCSPSHGTVMIRDRKWSELTGLTDMVGLAGELVHEATHIADYKAGLVKPSPTIDEEVAEELRAAHAQRDAVATLGGTVAQLEHIDATIAWIVENKVGESTYEWYHEPGGP